jgi:hypothetical protein
VTKQELCGKIERPTLAKTAKVSHYVNRA